ncbi:unnamed protein product [Linum tenue]|uniref:Peptidylprolyl isomerase n=1 Tax=Linum tenue TaxID=586396 RepID=A0AAV0Q9K4_9ROSI|nr:unnamed protein product [Linum tenue]
MTMGVLPRSIPRTLGGNPLPCVTPLIFGGGRLIRCCSTAELSSNSSSRRNFNRTRTCALANRRDVIGALLLGASGLVVGGFEAEGAGLPPEDKAKLCDESCEKELENVPMVSTESGLQYKDIKVGGGPSPPVGFQVIPESP